MNDSIPFVSISTLTGYVAMWAVRQSPYHAPDGLTNVCAEFFRQAMDFRLKDWPDDWPCIRCDHDTLSSCLKKCLLTQPQVLLWNERKNGNTSQFGFVSRYDKPNPDDDFIDLEALTGNIITSCVQEERRERVEIERCMRKNRPGLFKRITKILTNQKEP